jgi:HTH-type transcriptional regulator/antitoxin HigA
LDAALKSAAQLAEDYVSRVIPHPSAALHRKRVRTGSTLDEYALLAWEARVLRLAGERNVVAPFTPTTIDAQWLSELVQLSASDDGPVRARERLSRAGIALVIEPHMPGTHLDGACMLHKGLPVIGLTLRYDRLDNFWFVLLHELVHLTRHLGKQELSQVFDDLDSASRDAQEVEADQLAVEALVPEVSWEHALARYLQSPETIQALADELGVTPAIVAGRIRHESNNYVILADLVGQGQVRRLFPEVKFGA